MRRTAPQCARAQVAQRVNSNELPAMRQGSGSRRSRGRANGKRPFNQGPNRSFESNGPGVKLRGTASQVFDKYLALARDASSSGDRIAAENFYQHAEHYYRLHSAFNAERKQRAENERQDGDEQRAADNRPSGDGQDGGDGASRSEAGESKKEAASDAAAGDDTEATEKASPPKRRRRRSAPKDSEAETVA